MYISYCIFEIAISWLILNQFIFILLSDHVSLTNDDISSSRGGDDMDGTNQGQVGKHILFSLIYINYSNFNF